MLDFGFYNMDCLEGMRQFPDNYFELAIVDPPYGIKADKGTRGFIRRRNQSRFISGRLPPQKRYFTPAKAVDYSRKSGKLLPH